MKSYKFPESGEPEVASNVKLPLLVPDDPEVMDPLLTVEEGEHQSSPLVTALSDQICSWDVGRLQALAGLHSI